MKVKIAVAKKKAQQEELLRAQLAMLSLCAMCFDVFDEDDAFSKPKLKMSLGRVYEETKRCRAVLDPEFNPKKHDKIMKFGMANGLSRPVRH
jgi:hypothetical protein